VSQNRSLGKLLLFQKHWEWESSRVLGIDFFDLDLAIGQEVVENVVFVSTIVGSILPKDVEYKHLSIVIEETFKFFIWSSSFELDFNVFFNLSLIWWSLLHVNHSSSLSEEIIWVSFWSIELNAFVGKESSCEIITVNNSENSFVDVEIAGDVQVLPGVVLGMIFWIR
jgi:hypothetical protein